MLNDKEISIILAKFFLDEFSEDAEGVAYWFENNAPEVDIEEFLPAITSLLEK